MTHAPHILIVGGGYVGMYAARRLQRKLRANEATVTIVNPTPTMTYQPFLAEATAGSIEARHVVVSLRRMLRRTRVVTGEVSYVDHEARVATVVSSSHDVITIPYDEIVLAPGSVSRPLPIPGLAEEGIGFKTLGEAVYLRNHVLSRLDAAAAMQSPARRKAALTFVFIGGGYSGVEACAELEDMARAAMRYYPELDPADMRWLLVEAADRIMPEVSRSLSVYTADRLTRRGVSVRLETRVESMLDGHVVLSDGDEIDAETIVWTAGVKPNPLAARCGLPVDPTGRLACDADLRVRGVTGMWGAGDSASVPDLAVGDGAVCAPTAQNAVRQAKRLADNIVNSLRGKASKPYHHRYAGSVASLGLHKGVAEIYGIRLRGLPAWFLHRTYHLMMVPTLNRKVRVTLDWTLALLFRRETVAIGQIQAPRREWMSATGQVEPIEPVRRAG